MSLLATRGLTMRFGGVTAVDHVDFEVADGELRCLIGPNGAGKSTFFKCLTGQLAPTEGTITFAGKSIAGISSHDIARAGIGIKTQVPNLFDALSVTEHLWLAARRNHLGATTRKTVRDTLERVGIGDLAAKTVGTLAHGQRQLVELATVIAGEPRLVLLDEPAAGMTSDETRRTAEIIREINRTTALIVVEHDMQFIKLIANKVTVFHQGAILIEDDVDVVMRDPMVRDVYLGRSAA